MSAPLDLARLNRSGSYNMATSSHSPTPSKKPAPIGIASAPTTIKPAEKKECCERAVDSLTNDGKRCCGCWQKLSPCQKKLVCCGGVAAGLGGLGGILYATGAAVAIGPVGGVIIVCCGAKLILGGYFCKKACCKGQEAADVV